jgi:hypothetical protein
VSEDAGTEPRTVATWALIARNSNHSARSHPGYSVENTRDRLCVNAPNVVSSRQVTLVSSTLKEGVNKSFHLLQYETKMHSPNQNLTWKNKIAIYKHCTKSSNCARCICCYTRKINYRENRLFQHKQRRVIM